MHMALLLLWLVEFLLRQEPLGLNEVSPICVPHFFSLILFGTLRFSLRVLRCVFMGSLSLWSDIIRHSPKDWSPPCFLQLEVSFPQFSPAVAAVLSLPLDHSFLFYPFTCLLA